MDVIGIDLGGTNIKAGIISHEGIVKRNVVIPTPVSEGREGIAAAVANIVHELKPFSDDIEAIGMGSAGRIDRYTGRVLFATDNLPGWTGTNVKTILEAASGLPVYVENDVNVAALGEGWYGAAKDFKHYVLLSIGTGVGGALVHNGELVSGPTGSVGELGHIILYPDGEWCHCGQQGCVEWYVSGSALTRMAKRINQAWDSYTLIERAASGHAESVRQMTKFAEHLAVVLITIYNFYDPEIIVLGGGVGTSYSQWKQQLTEAITKLTPHQISIVPAQLGNDAGTFGAAYLALRESSKSH